MSRIPLVIKPYQDVDFFEVSRLLNSDERAVQATVRQFVERSYLPLIKQHHAPGTFPLEIVAEMAEPSLLGPRVQGPGCSGLSYMLYGLICEKLERGDSGYAAQPTHGKFNLRASDTGELALDVARSARSILGAAGITDGHTPGGHGDRGFPMNAGSGTSISSIRNRSCAIS